MAQTINLESITLKYQNGRQLTLKGEKAQEIAQKLFGDKNLNLTKLDWEIGEIKMGWRKTFWEKIKSWNPYG